MEKIRKFNSLFGSYFAGKVSNILFRKDATDALVEKATKDVLTGLYNRGAIFEQLEEYFDLSKRQEQPLSVILADIDLFKNINDTHGHMTGDDILRNVSRRLQKELRGGDKLGRYGGDEFLLILYPCGPSEIEAAAERFRKAVSASAIPQNDAPFNEIHVSISLGATYINKNWDIPINSLLKRADEALYESKANGRNCVSIHPPEP